MGNKFPIFAELAKMRRRILYMVNPVSGTKGKSALKTMITKKTKAAAIDFEILQSREDGNYEALKQKIADEKITDVVVCGGDGTINRVVAGIRQSNVNIGIIPMGSGNGLAFAAKIPKQTSKAIEIILRGHAEPADAFYINDRFSCMLCGIGFDAAVAHAFAKETRRGLQTYIKVSTIQFFKYQAHPFEIRLKDKLIKTDAFFISIANSNQFGNHFTIAPKANLADGLLDIVIVKKMNKLILPFSVIGQVTGINALQPVSEYGGKKNIIYLQTDALTIHNPGMAPLHIDGDPGETSSKFKIKIIKNCFRLLQP
jgi:diacylglycerol kinase (ATP)